MKNLATLSATATIQTSLSLWFVVVVVVRFNGPNFWATFFHEKKLCQRMGNILSDFSTNSSGHPAFDARNMRELFTLIHCDVFLASLFLLIFLKLIYS
jgi:hypothetical protein